MPGRGTDGRQARWNQHNEDRRRRIIGAAIEVLEESEPGTELSVQAIASRAGVSRTVVYRHFDDRDDLARAVQREILDRLWAELLPAITLDGTVPQIVERIVGTYVSWAVAHPSLHRLADHDTSEDGNGPLTEGMEKLASQIAVVIAVGLAAMGVEPDEEEQAALDPLVFGLIGAVFGAVRRWLARSESTVTAERLVELTSRSVWFVLDGHARSLGVTIDPDRPVAELIGHTAAVAASA